MKKMLTVPADEAPGLCAEIDALKGYPCWEQGEIGPPVWTERWTNGVPMEDGTVAIPVDDAIEAELGKKVKTQRVAREVEMNEFKRVVSDMDLEEPLP